MVHLVDAVNRGYSKVKIRTVDTGIVVLAISTSSKLPNDTEIWIAFGTGKDFSTFLFTVLLNHSSL